MNQEAGANEETAPRAASSGIIRDKLP